MYSRILNFIPAERVKFNEPMHRHTTFRIGGPADVLIMPESFAEVTEIVSFCKDRGISFFILGMGSNILVRDKGIRGVVIKLGNKLKNIRISDNNIYAETGIRLSELSKRAAAHSLSGLEFAEGIPGSLGGAVVMNAGAYGGEISKVVAEVEAINDSGLVKKFTPEQIQYGYRKSIFQNSDYIILAASFKLEYGEKEKIQATMREFAHLRREKQPLDLPSAGSTFRRPEGYYVGPMLEKMGLKGYNVGGAAVSGKHAGFIVNTGSATANDVINLIKYIQQKAREQFEVDLQPEIKIIGEA
ncbi:MAG: UDP-N-acetylmuramate dehydrogenase [Syntrophomonadaceae bacterium]|nr:UDP-N-acetylmuramate dehydrogenase [Syntrophomonadaceae bacterium]MDD3890159.1 UDP-N-acetylmuramate dehydrogenase [Syntrophomonadaceae bacterium]MDD4549269.1 UDP-N-acetylmuramate dehydrogenase [Syntrophomonadaceae bacterium]